MDNGIREHLMGLVMAKSTGDMNISQLMENLQDSSTVEGSTMVSRNSFLKHPETKPVNITKWYDIYEVGVFENGPYNDKLWAIGCLSVFETNPSYHGGNGGLIHSRVIDCFHVRNL